MDSSVPVDHLTHCLLEMGSLGEPGGRLADRSPQVTVSPTSTELGLGVCGAAVVLHGHCGLNSGLHGVHHCS